MLMMVRIMMVTVLIMTGSVYLGLIGGTTPALRSPAWFSGCGPARTLPRVDVDLDSRGKH